MAAYSSDHRCSKCLGCSLHASGHPAHPHPLHSRQLPPADAMVSRNHVLNSGTQTPEGGTKKGKQRGSRKRAGTSPAVSSYTEEEGKEAGEAKRANEEPTTHRHMTRKNRQCLSLPLTKRVPEHEPATKSACSRIRKNKATLTDKRRASVPEVGGKEDSSTPRRLFNNRAEGIAQDKECEEEEEDNETDDAEEEEEEEEEEEDQIFTLSNGDRNSNAKKTDGKNQNRNARRVGGRKRRGPAKKNPIVFKAARMSKPSAKQLVNFSSLKPIAAKCSKSGLGLVVTYRPIFTGYVSAQRKIRKSSGSRYAVNSASKSTKSARVKDRATSPGPPSSSKRDKATSQSPGFFDHIKSVISNRGQSPEATSGVTKWLQGLSRTGSPSEQEDNTAKPTKKSKPDDKKENVPKTCVQAKRAAKEKSPIPGPSWAPDEFQQPRRRSRSPNQMPDRDTSPSPRPRGRPRKERGGSSSHPRPSKGKGKSGTAEKHDECVSLNRPANCETRSPGSPPPASHRLTGSEGWNVSQSASPASCSSDSPQRQSGPDDEDQGHHAKASDSRSSHHRRHRRRKNRSSSGSSESSHAGHGHREKHRRTRHHHRRQRNADDDSSAKGPGTCTVM